MIWIIILIIIVLILVWLLFQWKKWANDYKAWVQQNCNCDSTGGEPPKEPGWP